MAVEFESAWVSCSTRPSELAEPELVLDEQHLVGDSRRHRRVAVAVAADPGAEAQGRGRKVRDDAVAGELVVDVLQERGHGAVVELGQVVEDVLGLVHRSQATDADLARLPQEQDRLAKPATSRRSSAGVGSAPEGLDEMGDVEQLGEHRAARRLGRVRREDGPELEATEGLRRRCRGRRRAPRPGRGSREARCAPPVGPGPRSAARCTCSVTLASWK